MKRRIAVYAGLMMCLAAAVCTSCSSHRKCSIGDIAMSDGSVLSPAKFRSYKGKAKPVAVIFSVTGGAYENSHRVLGVALEQSDTALIFAGEGSFGNKTSFLRNRTIVVNQTLDPKYDSYVNAGFTGDLDGSNNWKNVQSRDPSKHEIASYPAYRYAEEYCKGRAMGRCGIGWYLPSASELYALFLAESDIDDVLEKLDAEQVKNYAYWSSSQFYYQSDLTYAVNILDGCVEPCDKDSQYYVRPIREF